MGLIRNAVEPQSLSLSIPFLPSTEEQKVPQSNSYFCSKQTLVLFPLKFGNPDRSFSIRQDVKKSTSCQDFVLL